MLQRALDKMVNIDITLARREDFRSVNGVPSTLIDGDFVQHYC